MNTNTYFIEDHDVDIRQLFWKLILQWKLILVVACVFAVLGYGYAKYRNSQMNSISMSDASTGEVNSESMAELESESNEEKAYVAFQRYETALAREKQYLTNSLYMQLDPYHVFNTGCEFELKAKGQTDLNQLIMICRRLINDTLNSNTLNQIANKYNTKPEYIQELVTMSPRDNQYDSITEVSVTDADSDPVLMSDKDEKRYYLYINVKGSSSEFTEAVCQDLINCLMEKAEDFENYEYEISLLVPITSERVDTSVINDQNNAHARIYDYSDRIVKLNTIIDNLGKIKIDDEENEGGELIYFSGKKYAFFGFLGGAIFMLLLLILKYVFSDTIQTENDFRSWFVLNSLGSFPAFANNNTKSSSLKKHIWRKLEGSSIQLSEDDFYKMVATNLLNAGKDYQSILLTGTVEKSDLQLLEEHLRPLLKQKCEHQEFIFADNLLGSSDTRANLQKTDGVVFVEKRKRSCVDDIKEEIEVVSALNKKILGVVLL